MTPPAPTPPPDPPTLPTRLVVVENVYHQVGNEPPVAHDARYLRTVDSDEQAYVRKVTVGPQWKPLDFGWAGPVPSMVVLTNDEARHGPPTIPTPEQAADMAARVVVVAGSTERGVCPVVAVRPGETARFEPAAPLYVMCRNGRTARCVVYAVPGDRSNDTAVIPTRQGG